MGFVYSWDPFSHLSPYVVFELFTYKMERWELCGLDIAEFHESRPVRNPAKCVNCVICAHEYSSLQRPEECIRSSRAEVIGYCEMLLNMGTGT